MTACSHPDDEWCDECFVPADRPRERLPFPGGVENTVGGWVLFRPDPVGDDTPEFCDCEDADSPFRHRVGDDTPTPTAGRWTVEGHRLTEVDGRTYEIFRHTFPDADGARVLHRALVRRAEGDGTPAPTAPWTLAEDEATYIDIESAIHQHMGHDGQSDETNDWVTDLMAAIASFIERAVNRRAEAAPDLTALQQAVIDAAVDETKAETDPRSLSRLEPPSVTIDYELGRACLRLEAEARALREQLAVLRRHIGDASYNALLARAATADPTPDTDTDDG